MKPIETARLVTKRERAFVLPALRVRIPTQPEKNRDQPDRIDRDKERDESEEKFLEVRIHLGCDLIA